MSEQSEWEKLKAASVTACFALVGSQSFIAFLNVFCNIAFAHLLSPTEYGIFAVGNVIVKFMNIMEDMGVGTALVRQEQEPTQEELTTAFLLLFLVAFVPFLILFSFASLLAPIFHFGSTAIPVLYWLACGKIFGILRVVPAAVLQRKMDFATLTKFEVTQTVIYYLLAVILAFNNFGALSLAIGATVSQCLATIALFISTGILFKGKANFRAMIGNIRFGLQYQLSSVLSSFRDSVVPLLGGIVLGPTIVGQASFAISVGNLPRILSDVLGRSYLPLFSKVQADRLLLRKLVESVLFWSNLIIIGVNVIYMPLVPATVKLVFGEQWLPSLPLLYAYLIGNIVMASIRPLEALTFALGKARINLSFHGLLMLLSWAVTVPLLITMGLSGIAIAQLVILAIQLLYIVVVRKYLEFDLRAAYRLPLLIGSMTAVVMFVLVSLIEPTNQIMLFVLALIGIAAWFFLGFLLAADRFKRMCSSAFLVVRPTNKNM